MTSPTEALARLRAAAASGELDALAERHGLAPVLASGTTVHGRHVPRDLDVTVASCGGPVDLAVGLRDVLVHEYVEIDLEQGRAAVPLAHDGYRRPVRQAATFVAGLPGRLRRRPVPGRAARPGRRDRPTSAPRCGRGRGAPPPA